MTRPMTEGLCTLASTMCRGGATAATADGKVARAVVR
jgi:hypothetical protein